MSRSVVGFAGLFAAACSMGATAREEGSLFDASADAAEQQPPQSVADEDDGRTEEQTGISATDADDMPAGSEYSSCNDDGDCSEVDGDLCTVPSCSPGGICEEVPPRCDFDQNTCARASCNPQTGACEYVADDSACGSSENCVLSTCELAFDDAGLVASRCVEQPLDEVQCDDGDPCTQSDSCVQGSCSGEPLACDEPPPPTCEGSARVVYLSGQCDDGACAYDAARIECPNGCVDGKCEDPLRPLISELLYDSPGTDDNVWIELWAPPDSTLQGLHLDAINGSSGARYATLALDGQAPESGIVLLVNTRATDPALRRSAHMITEFADLQNGPDSLVLRERDDVLDAVGYGSFQGTQVFAGEGQPAPDVSSVDSLGRIDSVFDTDDNATDFVAMPPTPGVRNIQ